MTTNYDDAVGAVINNDNAMGAKFNFMNNYGTNPDAVAEAQRVAKKTGVPVDTALNVPDVKKQAAIGDIDFNGLASVAPATASLLADAQKARIAHDDVENMGTMESLVNSFKRGVPALQSTLPTIQAINSSYGIQMFTDIDKRLDNGEDPKVVLSDYSKAGLAPLPWQTSEQTLASYRKLRSSAMSNLQAKAADNISEVADLQKERAAIPQPASVGRMMNAKTWGDAFSAFGEQPITNIASIGPESLMQSLPGILTAIPAGMTMGPGGAAAAMGLNSFLTDFAGTAQSALQDHNVDTTNKDAIRTAMSNPEILADITRQAGQHASVVAAFDALSGGVASKTLLTKNAVAKLGEHSLKKELANIAVQAPVQAALGGAGEALGELNAGQELQPGQILGEIVGEFFGTPSEVMSASGSRLRENFSKANRAEQGAETVSNINDLAKASKVLTRDPDTFEKFVANAAQDGPLDHVYIDANTLMQSGIAENLAAVSPSVAEQLPAAAQSGGTVAIPIEEYTSRIAPTGYSQQLLDHIRTEPEGFSRAEAQEYLQTQDESLQRDVERILSEKQGDDTFKQSADNVRATIKGQLDNAGRFTPQVHDVYSNLVSNFYAVQAARLGITPEEMYQQFPLKVQAESITGGDQFNQGAINAPEFQNWFRDSKAVDKDGKPLVMYHGTKADFTAFDMDSIKRGIGLYFAANPEESNLYAGGRILSDRYDEGGKILPVYLSLKNPYIYRPGEKYKKIKASNREGYDGVIKLNTEGQIDVAIAFKPEQIKSAIGNTGRFNPNDPNILHQDQTPVATLKGDELGELDSDNVMEKARTWFKENLQGKTISRPELGNIRFTGKSWGKIKNGVKRDLDKARLMSAIPDIIKNGGYSGRQPLYKERTDGIVAFHYFTAPVKLGDDLVHVGVSVGEDDRGNLFYNINKDPEMLMAKQKAHRDPSDFEARGDEPSVDGETTYKQSLPENSDDINIDILNSDYLQQARGAFNPNTFTISLLKNADLSTFLHESGHFFLETLNDLANRENAPAEIKADMNTLLKDFGVKDLATWNAMSIDEKRPSHEKFARGFERYLFEGKAPSIEMQGIFQRFRAWMLNVYKKISALDVQLSDDVRSVFDRMLASTEEIQLAEQSRSMMPLFKDGEQAGMSPIEFRDYQRLGVDATNEAIEDLQTKGLRDMQWLRNARGRELSRLQKAAKERRAEVQKEVSVEVMQEPIYKAWQFLKNKKDGDQPTGKLSTKALQDMYAGDGDQYAMLDWKRLRDQRMIAEDGIHPDVVAEQFGFSSGDELVRKLVQTEMPADTIEALTDTRMLEEHAELSSTEALQREADKAIHNDVRARMVATEANALAKAVGQRRILASAAKAYARAMIDRLKIRSIKPGQYANAEMRASSNAESAMRRGDLTTAAAEKRNQLVQQYAVRAAYDAQDEVNSGVRYLNKFNKLVTTIDIDYREQIESLLERFDLRKGQSLSDIDKRKTLVQWMDSQRGVGLEPDIPNALQNEAYRKSYKEMTLEEFRGLVDSVKQIEHLGRLKKRLLTARDNKEFEAIRDELANSILEHSQNRKADTRTPTTNTGRFLGSIKAFGAAHIKAATWSRIMDGNKDGGPMWEYFVRSANERAAHEASMRAEATRKLLDVMAPVLKEGKMGGKGTYFPNINRSLNKESVFAMALNMGNEGNTQRLLGGENWTLQQITPVLQTLTAADWKAVQQIWDHFETYRPLIAEKERRVFGKEPDWIEPQPFNIDTSDGQTVSLKGGYYPIQYDSRASIRAEEHADAQEAKDAMLGAYNATTTRRSFTKTRANEVIGRPLLLTSSGIYKGLNEVIHDLSWHEWLIDTNRLLKSEKLDSAIRSTYGPDVVNQFKTWRDDIATEASKTNNAVESVIQLVRQNVSMTGLGYNLLAAIQQPIGLTQSIVRVGLPWITKGVGQYLSNPIAKTKEVHAKSEFMQNRARTRFRELNELKNKVQGKNSVREAIIGHAFTLMAKVQSTVDIPTWAGAYEKAISEGADESKAIAIADQSVIDSQGDGAINSLSAVERGGPATKLFTVFYSYMNTALNLLVNSGMSERSAIQKTADFLMLTIIPTSLTVLLKEALVPSGDGGDDSDLLKKLLKENIEFFFGLFVLGREVAAAGSTLAGVGDKFGYQGPAGLRPISDAIAFTQALDKSVEKGEPTAALLRTAINIVGGATGLPSAQINRSVKGIDALAKGDTKNPMAIGFGFDKQK